MQPAPTPATGIHMHLQRKWGRTGQGEICGRSKGTMLRGSHGQTRLRVVVLYFHCLTRP